MSFPDSSSKCKGPEVGRCLCCWRPGLFGVGASGVQKAHSLEVPSKDLGFSLRAMGDSKGRRREKNLGVQRTA